MIVGINQPYFLPYLGYWQLVHSVDVFAIADDYNYIKNGWINRNYILSGGEKQYLSLPVRHASQNRLICDHELADPDLPHLFGQVRHAYTHAPFFGEGMEVFEEIVRCPSRRLSDFLFHSHEVLCAYLGIRTRLLRTSSMTHGADSRRENRIYDYCRQLQADTYHNLMGGTALYDYDAFIGQNLILKFVRPCFRPYPQQASQFVPGLSILDVIMNNSPEEAHSMLSDYTLVSG